MRPLFERLSDATRLTKSGDLKGAVASIQAELAGGAYRPTTASASNPRKSADVVQRSTSRRVMTTARLPLLLDHQSGTEVDPSHARVGPTVAPAAAQFLRGRYSNEAGTRDYRLFVPPDRSGKLLPLVVMLHGCTQDPDAFAAGTAMNEIALSRGFVVLYPAQAQSANANRCWNWFERAHQQRNAGEPAILAGMTREVMKQHDIDPRRIYVAGLSAGGAMAVILGDTYPELYAAIGVHSGLPSGVAHDLPSALVAMKGGHVIGAKPGSKLHAVQRSESRSRGPQSVPPTIVFHGDQDKTVRSTNAEQIVASCNRSASSTLTDHDLKSQTESARSNNGREYTRTSHHAANGHPVSELWTIHGAGHAWSGGRKEGSYTDPRGPNASEEMIRFFFSHQRPA